jgi:hypothetical protein
VRRTCITVEMHLVALIMKLNPKLHSGRAAVAIGD